MAQRETSRSIDDAAAAWVARQDRAPLSAGDRERLRQWLAADPRRPGAFLRAKAASLQSESAAALGLQYDPEEFRAPPAAPPRRKVLVWSAAMAASVLVAMLSFTLMQAPTAYATERGEMRLVPLGDGSTAMLNTSTKIAVRYDSAQRLVRILEGEAFFEVVQDPARPFIVEVDARRLHTAGAAFVVRKLAGAPVEVVVQNGHLELHAGHATPHAVLEANTRLSVPVAAGASGQAPDRIAVDKVPAERMARELAWREGKIAFHGEDLSAASAAFARYSDVRIVVADPELAREPVTGLFAANDPVGFSHAVASIFEAEVALQGSQVVVSRAARQD